MAAWVTSGASLVVEGWISDVPDPRVNTRFRGMTDLLQKMVMEWDLV
jgi:hypothetical protein